MLADEIHLKYKQGFSIGFEALDFTVPEKYTDQIKTGQIVTFGFEGTDKKLGARVIATESNVTENTRSLTVRALITGKDERLIPGAFAKVILSFDPDPNALLVPTQAVLPQARGKKVLVGAADTFRAGAVDQLKRWAERSDADFIGAPAGSDPAAVAFNAIDAGINRGSDVVIIDTAGRLHTSSGLMDELKKIHRVIARRIPGAPHETLLVLDATIGQNALAQARTFAEAVPITGLVMTKLDGTARGGIVLAVREALGVPIKFIGTGETMADIEPFNPVAFAAELVEG